MKDGFRQSQAWWHTWTGLVCGWLLFAIFFTGTTAVFRSEGQFWLQPELHAPAVAMDEARMVAAVERVLREQAPPGAQLWSVNLPDARSATLSARWLLPARPGLPAASRNQFRHLDPASGALLAAQPRQSAAMNKLYQFHFSLLQGRPGIWVVGAMAVVMLVLLVSGVIIHKKFFKDFFTFRPDKAPGRAWLDAHNVSSVMVLPFSLMITYTGLVIFWSIWMPAGVQVAYDGDLAAMRAEQRSVVEQPKSADAPAELLPLASFVKRAQSVGLDDLRLRSVIVFRPGGTQTQMRVTHERGDLLWGNSDSQTFNGVTGERLERRGDEGRAADVTQQVFRIVHEIRFAGPLLRWLYFLMSAACCVMIATGLVLWTVKRREQALKQTKKHGGVLDPAQMQGWRIAAALNVGTVAGLLIATAAMLWSNRLIPAQLAERELWEVRVFFYAWMLSGLWALLRARRLTVQSPGGVTARRMWSEQLGFAALLYTLIPLVSALTAPHSALWVTVPSGQWVVASFDLTMLGTALLLALTARKVARPRAVVSRRAAASVIHAEERAA